MSLYTPKPGRPRQPWCPDCKRSVPPVYTEKAPGQGYCRAHQSNRVRKNYLARRNEGVTDPRLLHPETREQMLVQDIRDGFDKGMPFTVEMIQNLYLENALPKPTEEEVQREFFPDRLVEEGPSPEQLADMERQLREATEELQRNGNPFSNL